MIFERIQDIPHQMEILNILMHNENVVPTFILVYACRSNK